MTTARDPWASLLDDLPTWLVSQASTHARRHIHWAAGGWLGTETGRGPMCLI